MEEYESVKLLICKEPFQIKYVRGIKIEFKKNRYIHISILPTATVILNAATSAKMNKKKTQTLLIAKFAN